MLVPSRQREADASLRDIEAKIKKCHQNRNQEDLEEMELERLKSKTEEKRLENLKELSPSPDSLNSMNLTIKGDDITSKMVGFLKTQNLKIVSNNGVVLAYKLNIIDSQVAVYKTKNSKEWEKTYALLGKDFIELTVIDRDAITISFNGIIDTRGFNRKSDMRGDIRHAEAHFKQMFTDENDTTDEKTKILKSTIDLLRKQNLLAATKINGLSYMNPISGTFMGAEYYKMFLLGAKKEQYVSNEDHYTLPIVNYRAEIKNPQKFVNVDLPTMQDTEACREIRKSIKSRFKNIRPINALTVTKTDDKFHIHSNINCRPSWSQPVVIREEALGFSPFFGEKVNYYSLQTLPQERYNVELYNSGKRTNYDSYWATLNPSLVYEEVEKIGKTIVYVKVDSAIFLSQVKEVVMLQINELDFTLADDIDDIVTFIATIPARLTEDAVADATFVIAPNKVKASLQYYLG